MRAARGGRRRVLPRAKAIFASSGGGEKKDDVDKAVEALVEGARKYRRKHRRPPVLVLDDVDRCLTRLIECIIMRGHLWSVRWNFYSHAIISVADIAVTSCGPSMADAVSAVRGRQSVMRQNRLSFTIHASPCAALRRSSRASWRSCRARPRSGPTRASSGSCSCSATVPG